MTDDRLTKVRAEIEMRKKEVIDNIFELGNSESERIGLFDRKELYDDLLSFIDSMTKEPVSEDLDLGCGVIWKGEEPVSEDFEEAVNAYIGYAPEVDESSSTYGKRQAFIAGANWQKQQMMAKAVDATEHIDAGGYPYIPQMELYDYDKDIPLAKEGEKVKVIVIKED